MTLLEHATRLQDMAQGVPSIFDAVDTYYADDVTVVEATGETFTGKETQKGRIQEWIEGVVEIHDGGVRSIAAHETSPGSGVALIESYTDATFTEGGRFLFEEVAVQRWENGKVVHERFYYNMPDGAPEEA